jgi:hypothetical protein
MQQKNVAAPNAVKLFHCKICDKGYPRQTEYENHLRSYDHNHRQRLADMKQITASNDRDNTRTSKRGLDEMRSIPVEGGKGGLGRGFRKVGMETGGMGTAGAGFKKVGQETGGSGFKKVGVNVEGAPSGFKKVGVTTNNSAPSGSKKVGVEAKGSGSEVVAVTSSGSEYGRPTMAPVKLSRSTAKVEDGPSAKESKTPTTGFTTNDENECVPKHGADVMEMDETEIKKKGDIVMGEDNDEEEEEVVTWEEYDFLKPTGCDHANCPGCKTIGIMDEGWVVVKPLTEGTTVSD